MGLNREQWKLRLEIKWNACFLTIVYWMTKSKIMSVNEVGGKLTSWWRFRWRGCGRLSIQQKFRFEISEIPRGPLEIS